MGLVVGRCDVARWRGDDCIHRADCRALERLRIDTLGGHHLRTYRAVNAYVALG